VVLVVRLDKPAQLHCLFDGELLPPARDLEAGEHRVPLSELVPLQIGKVRFTLTADDEEAVLSHCYAFVGNYSQSFNEFMRRENERIAVLEEQQRLEAACPPPKEGQTWQDLVDEQRRLILEAINAVRALFFQALSATGKAREPGVSFSEIPALLGDALAASNRCYAYLLPVERHCAYADYYQKKAQESASAP
jgi:hypothetical protein